MIAKGNEMPKGICQFIHEFRWLERVANGCEPAVDHRAVTRKSARRSGCMPTLAFVPRGSDSSRMRHDPVTRKLWSIRRAAGVTAIEVGFRSHSGA